MAEHNSLGEWGEQLATEYLLAQGYTIHTRDEREGHKGELDIIAFKDNMVVFVEVKTRADFDDNDPMELFPPARRRRMVRAADQFVRHLEIDLLPRYDIIVVNGTPQGEYRLEHYPDAFFPSISSR